MRNTTQHSHTERSPAPVRSRWEKPHRGTRTEAPNGQGSYHSWPPGRTLDRPVLDGSTQSAEYEHEVDNPWRGFDDPGLITHPEWGRDQRPRWFWWRRKRTD